MTNKNEPVRCEMCDQEFEVEDDRRSHVDHHHVTTSDRAPQGMGAAQGGDEHIGHQDMHSEEERRAS